jgi:tetratricopeptide (TPR) repeat protein
MHALIGLVLVLAMATGARADDIGTCENTDINRDDAIAACTRVIASPRTKASLRGEAYCWRGYHNTSVNYGAAGVNPEQALSDLENGIQLSPRLPFCYRYRGDLLMKKGETERALADFDRLIHSDPRSGEGYRARGDAFVAIGKLDLAAADYATAIQLNPRNPDAYSGRAMTFAARGDAEHALADMDVAIRLAPNEEAYRNSKATILISRGDLDAAIAVLDDIIRAKPRYVTAYNSRGVAWREKGDFDRALADFDQATALDPDMPNPYANRGLIARAQGNLDRALADFNEALRRDPRYADAYANRGLTYEAKGDVERARADFKAALALPPLRALTRRFQDAARVRLALLGPDGTAAPEPQPAAPSPTPAGEGRRIALVIGNSHYAGAQALPNPANDAQAVAAALRGMKFEVSEGIDLDHAGMDRLIRAFLLDAAKAQLALLFYAGHGMQIDGRNYLLPVDVKLTADELAASMTDVDKILAGLDDQVRTNVVILDACRDNPFAAQALAQAGTTRSVASAGLAAPSSLGAGATLGAGTLIAFATAPGQVALDGTGADSPFSTALVRHIATPGLEVQAMLTRVRAEVVAVTRSRQVPWSNSSLLGEVYLAGKP